MIRELVDECDFSLKLWKLQALAVPEIGNSAAKAAAQADFVILSMHRKAHLSVQTRVLENWKLMSMNQVFSYLALSRGFTAIVSGRSYEAKIEIGHKLVPLIIIVGTATFFLHNVYRIFAQTIRWASMYEALARFLKAHPNRCLESSFRKSNNFVRKSPNSRLTSSRGCVAKRLRKRIQPLLQRILRTVLVNPFPCAGIDITAE